MKSFVVELGDWLELRKAAYHEAGHYIAALHWGVDVCCSLAPEDGRSVEPHKHLGRTRILPTTPFRGAVIGWAGPVGEWFSFCSQPGEFCVERFLNEFDYAEISESDERYIFGHPAQRRACKTAAAIVRKRYQQFAHIAESLLARKEG